MVLGIFGTGCVVAKKGANMHAKSFPMGSFFLIARERVRYR